MAEGKVGYQIWQPPKRSGKVCAARPTDYLCMFLSTFGELLQIIMPFIQKEDWIMPHCFIASQTRPYSVQQPLLHRLFDHVWGTSWKPTVILSVKEVYWGTRMMSSLTAIMIVVVPFSFYLANRKTCCRVTCTNFQLNPHFEVRKKINTSLSTNYVVLHVKVSTFSDE